jgi:hypothetical protein
MAMQYIQTGGDSDGYWIEVPDAPAPAPAVATGKKTPAELGFSPQLQQQFAQAGITELPEWMGRYASGNWNYSDLVNDYKTIAGADPSAMGTTGKAGDILSNMGWSLADQGLHYVGTQPIVETRNGVKTEVPGGLSGSYAPSGTTWGAGDQDYFEQAWMGRKQAPNVGAWEQSIKPAMMGIGSIASMAAAPYLAGAGAAVEGGLVAAEGGAVGSNLAADLAAGGMLAEYGGGATAAGVGSGSLSGLTGLSEYGFANSAPVAAETAGGTGLDAYLGTAGLGTGMGDIGGAGATLGAGGATGGAGAAVLGAGGGAAGGAGGALSSIGSWLGTGNNAMTVAGLGSSVLGGLLGYNAQQNSIDAAKDTSKDSIAFQKYMYDQAVNNYAPFRQLGLDNISALNSASATGDSGKYISELESLGKNFTFDATDPAYTQKMKLATEANDKALASRGMYNSRAGLNLQDETTRNIQASEYDKQFNRKYGTISDLFNMTNKNAATDYSKLLDMVKIGSGAASSAGSAATNLGSSVASTYGQLANNELQSGQSTASLFSGLGAQPLNYLLLQSLLNKN